jgi:general secretion pathway protein D
MRTMICAVAVLIFGSAALAAENKNIDFSYKDAELVKVIGDYSRASGQKFIIDPGVHGKITIMNPGPVSVPEAFNQLSSALALNSIGISKQDDTMIVMQSRAIERNLIDVGQELPVMKPERMFTWVINLKYTSADEVNKQLRILTSKDGELVPYTHNNQIYVTDWVSNLYRIQKIMREIDIPAGKNGKIEAKKTNPGEKTPPVAE